MLSAVVVPMMALMPFSPTLAKTAVAAKGRASVPVPSYQFIHDPSMIRQGTTWYLYSTGDPNGAVNGGDIQIRTSTNLRSWKLVGTVFSSIPAWITDRLGPIPNLWAPDISYFGGRYHLYYAASSFGSNHSLIALATSPTLDPHAKGYHWTDRGEVYASNSSDDYNAIDPALISGAGGSKWLVFGSFWSGIKLLALDAATGKPSSRAARLYSLAQAAPPDPEEGAYVVHHGRDYYLFVSRGTCCSGIGSTYEVIVGRSRSITGPYVDPRGRPMSAGGGMELLGSSRGMIGPGSGSVTTGPGGDLFDYHYYDAWNHGDPWLQVRRLLWTPSGWPVTGPPLVPVPGAPR
ncbi:MAG: arabinan endo-1,5-alpha-L-arabinosidase [Actinomycetota bacterium]|nr:arabinan endo-1,5-alpha-L-arabinosidase [Actinomycetota bacterium]